MNGNLQSTQSFESQTRRGSNFINKISHCVCVHTIHVHMSKYIYTYKHTNPYRAKLLHPMALIAQLQFYLRLLCWLTNAASPKECEFEYIYVSIYVCMCVCVGMYACIHLRQFISVHATLIRRVFGISVSGV